MDQRKSVPQLLRAYEKIGLKDVQIKNVFINKDNLDSLISKSGLTGEIDVLSLRC